MCIIMLVPFVCLSVGNKISINHIISSKCSVNETKAVDTTYHIEKGLVSESGILQSLLAAESCKQDKTLKAVISDYVYYHRCVDISINQSVNQSINQSTSLHIVLGILLGDSKSHPWL